MSNKKPPLAERANIPCGKPASAYISGGSGARRKGSYSRSASTVIVTVPVCEVVMLFVVVICATSSTSCVTSICSDIVVVMEVASFKSDTETETENDTGGGSGKPTTTVRATPSHTCELKATNGDGLMSDIRRTLCDSRRVANTVGCCGASKANLRRGGNTAAPGESPS